MLAYYVIYQRPSLLSCRSEAVVPRILIINPNSSETVTQAMDTGLEQARAGIAHVLECVTIVEAPQAIESAADIEAVAPLVADFVSNSDADAFVIACFSDPGLTEAREVTAYPVVGMGEAAYLEALQIGSMFGVVSILEGSIPRHAAHIQRLGVSGRLAGDRSIDTGVGRLSEHDTASRIIEVGRRLRDDDGADVLILGCAGMGSHRPVVEAELGIPVIDPVQAASLQAASIVTLGYRRGAA